MSAVGLPARALVAVTLAPHSGGPLTSPMIVSPVDAAEGRASVEIADCPAADIHAVLRLHDALATPTSTGWTITAQSATAAGQYDGRVPTRLLQTVSLTEIAAPVMSVCADMDRATRCQRRLPDGAVWLLMIGGIAVRVASPAPPSPSLIGQRAATRGLRARRWRHAHRHGVAIWADGLDLAP